MMKKLIATLVLSTTLPTLASEQVEFCNLQGPISTRAAGRDAGELVRTYMQTRQVVYVEGFLGQKNQSFYDGTVAIHEVDPKIPVTRLFPNPELAIESNVAVIMRELNLAAKKYPGRDIVLIGMSKGAAEIVQLALTHPEIFMKDNVHGFVVDVALPLNASIGGSYLADLELGDVALNARWEKYKTDNNISEGWFERWFGGFLKRMFLNTDTPGFRSLSTVVSKARNAALLSGLTPETSKIFKEKIRFVTTHRTGENALDMPSYMLRLAGFLATEGKNDGILFEKDQLLAGVGMHIMSIQGASHFNLTGGYAEAKCRKEFTFYLLLQQATAL